MVASDVGVQVPPEALDAIVLGAVGREKVENEEITMLRQLALRLLALVNDVVVEDEVNSVRSRIHFPKALQEYDEPV